MKADQYISEALAIIAAMMLSFTIGAQAHIPISLRLLMLLSWIAGGVWIGNLYLVKN